MFGKSYTVARFAGIPVKLHWSFGLLVLTLVFLDYQKHGSPIGILYLLLYVSILFICVVLHEYGHALMARYFGIKTRDIILSPIGGIARLEEIPEEPKKELYIAIAGPLVNLTIAALVGSIILITQQQFLPDITSVTELYHPQGIVLLIFWMNVILFTFNLMPALPMDGGRILRALLSMKMDRLRSTRISMYIAKFISFGLFVYGVYSIDFLLAFIGVFVFYSAGAEYQNISLKRRLETTDAQSIMKKDYSKVTGDMDYAQLISLYQQTGENNFLLFDENDNPIGNIPYPYLADYVKHKPQVRQLAGDLYDANVTRVNRSTKLIDLFNQMQENGISMVAVIDSQGQILGVIDRHILQDWMASNLTGSFISRLFR